MIDPNENILPYILISNHTENHVLLYGDNFQIETKFLEN
jgi:hypothetical protein